MNPSRRTTLAASAALLAPDLVYAQHAAVLGKIPAGTIWLNANESPEGPPAAARFAMRNAIGESGRYSHRALAAIQEYIAKSFGFGSAEVLLGNGSSEVLHCALEAFTSAKRPLITSWPTWEMMAQIAARSGREVIRIPLRSDWSADVEQMAAAAGRCAEGALVHLGNPNNPTSSLTAGKEVQWLQNRLPKNTQLIVDEAYMDYVDPSLVASALPFVRQGANLIVTRTFSKLYGLAGARFGLACAPSELIAAMQPFRENVPGIVGARAAEAALGLGERFVAGRRAARVEVRESFCRWLTAQGLRFIPPTANFVLIEIPAPVAELIPRMLARGVAVGRRFDTFDRRLRLAVGTAAEMKRVEQELPAVLEELSRLGIR